MENLEKAKTKNLELRGDLKKASLENLDLKDSLEKTKVENLNLRKNLEEAEAKNVSLKENLEKAQELGKKVAVLNNDLREVKTELEVLKEGNRYELHDPTFKEVKQFIEGDDTDKNERVYMPQFLHRRQPARHG